MAAALAVGGWAAAGAWGPALLAGLAERGYEVERPELAWALMAIPALVLARAHSLSDLPRVQQALSLLLKSAFVAAIALSLVNVQELEKEPKRSAIVYVVDVSESVPDAVLERAREAVEATWRASGEHEVRLVVFAGEAREVPLPRAPAEGEPAPAFPALPRLGAQDARVGQATDVQGALRLAFTLLADGRLPRIVLVTDGLETRGAVAAELETARRFGIPVHYRDYTDVPRPGEVMVTGVSVPGNLRPNIPFAVKATVRATRATTVECALTIDGEVVDTTEAALAGGDAEDLVEIEAVVKQGGDKRVAMRCAPGEGESEGAGRAAAPDRFATNNRYEIPVKVPRKPRVLYVEGERRYRNNLAAALDRDFDIELRGARGVPSSLADAKGFDLIFVSDVPRVGAMGYQNMTTTQMRVLEQYARSGGGLIFAGGENSFGPGGYTQTYLERKVLP
ncbi:MAG: hypothetical protein CSA66_06695, partial [Proteobacteria bacterium]